MGNFNRPEGQTTSDNFLKSEIEKDFLRAQSGWGELSEEELAYLGKRLKLLPTCSGLTANWKEPILPKCPCRRTAIKRL